MPGQKHRTLVVACLLSLAFLFLFFCQVFAQEGEGDRVTKPFLNNVIQLTVTFSKGDIEHTEHGFGFVVGERDDLLYVITAEHVVVFKDDPDFTTDQIQARFYRHRGKPRNAELLDLSYPELDIALLEVPKPSQNYTWETKYFFSNPKRNDQVWFIGRNEDWWVPPEKAVGSIMKGPSIVNVQFPVYLPSIQPGTSGAPLITKEGIVGMIIADSSEESLVLSIEAIKDIVTEQWYYPWGLEEFQVSTATPTPTPLPPTPTPRPTMPEPTPAPSQEGKEWIEPLIDMEFVRVPEGCFRMGSPDNEKGRDDDEGPVHEVCLDGFWMGKYEVTQAQWQQVMGNSPSYFEGNNRPVEQVSWHDAQEFINKLNSRSNFTFRLPSEAEWEYAARAGTQTAYYFGNDSSRLGEYAWYDGNSGNETHPVGTLKPNEWGLYDMHGNVWEWCQDIYRSDAYRNHQRQNPLITSGGSDRGFRGGSWFQIPSRLRSADRYNVSPADRSRDVGLRLVRKN